VPKLADKGIYLASESTMYRLLRSCDQQHRRGRTAKPQANKNPTTHTASAANQLWSWDITYCPSAVRGLYYYLYMIEDVFSRKVVGWEIYRSENGEHASELVQKTVLKEQCFRKPLVLHSDNGSPMKSATLLSKMQELGITPSRGRPRVSNDNAYSESLFKTMKYKPDWPVDGFKNIEDAQAWVNRFVAWYNGEHCHSGIEFVPPAVRHSGRDREVLARRKAVYEAAKAKNPKRWSRNTRAWQYQDVVTLNPEKNHSQELKAA
jgi:putative transposase